MRSARDCCFLLAEAELFHLLAEWGRNFAARGRKALVFVVVAAAADVVVGGRSGPKPWRREERRRCFHMADD